MLQDKQTTYETLVKLLRYIAAQFFVLKQEQVNIRHAKRELIILAGLTFVWALSIWTDNHQEFSSAEGRIFALHCFVVLSVQCLIYVIFFLLAKKQLLHRIIPLLIVTGFAVVNFYLLILIHSDRIAIMGAVPTLLLLMALFAISLIVIKKFRDMDQSPLLMSVLILTLLLVIGGSFFWNQHKKHAQLAEIGKFPEHFTFPEFKQRPNVYFFFFDSLIPEAMSRKFLGIDKLTYISQMRSENLHVLKNTFADRVPTNDCLNSFIAMDLSYYDNIPSRKMRWLFDTGMVTGPLYEIFRRNDYKIQLIFPTSSPGPTSESRIDYYGVSNETGLCDTEYGDYALLGYCMPAILKLRQRLLGGSKRPDLSHAEHAEQVYNRIDVASKSPDKWLTLAYIWRPKHTPMSFSIYKRGNLKKYISEFKAWRDPETADIIYMLMRKILELDPDSVAVFLGDHGTWVSRGLEFVAPERRPISPKELFQERHAVAAAVYPKDFCFDEFEKLSSVVRIGRVIAKCLSGGKDPLPAEYQANDDHFRYYFYE